MKTNKYGSFGDDWMPTSWQQYHHSQAVEILWKGLRRSSTNTSTQRNDFGRRTTVLPQRLPDIDFMRRQAAIEMITSDVATKIPETSLDLKPSAKTNPPNQ
jgi:hypothetical protein